MIKKRGKRGSFHDYDSFIRKFEAKKTTDDCYTPQPIYDAVVDYVFEQGHLPEDAEIVRPFYPGGDYTAEEYPEGCVVIDNPPFSILSQIIRFYVGRGVKFFLFAPTLTLFNSAGSCTKIVCGAAVTYDNGAKVATSFVTNIWGDGAIICDNELYRTIKAADEVATKAKTKELRKIDYPDCVVSAALLGKIAKRVSLTLPASEIAPIKSAGGVSIFGGGVYTLDQGHRRESSSRESSSRESSNRESSSREGNTYAGRVTAY